ncbi:hypothetical protein PAXINDRAFT_181254 [Paxillus involutus ATCC 200175]|uniref:Uncharacterized protein n=1 Tax=Paxillus involutus ATCC 200175 TaxID=664439 RepID=A0A0C9TTR1_PAXIN|nr:hypothetical protein PAXINDRAFT_181254 [Paxillus involutus ATCC 200175]
MDEHEGHTENLPPPIDRNSKYHKNNVKRVQTFEFGLELLTVVETPVVELHPSSPQQRRYARSSSTFDIRGGGDYNYGDGSKDWVRSGGSRQGGLLACQRYGGGENLTDEGTGRQVYKQSNALAHDKRPGQVHATSGSDVINNPRSNQRPDSKPWEERKKPRLMIGTRWSASHLTPTGLGIPWTIVGIIPISQHVT